MPSSLPGLGARLYQVTALFLCLLIATPSVIAQPSPVRKNPAKQHVNLDSDQRIVHLLNRFTFGPTPDDIVRVRKLGIDRWFNEQLHPNRIPNPVLDARLTEFPALQLPVGQLLYRFPSNAEIRQAANGKRPAPDDPYLSAIYTRHIALYQEKQEKKAETAADPKMANGAEEKMVPTSVATATPSSEEPRTLSPPDEERQIRTTLALPPSERINHILAMPTSEYEQFRSEMKGPQKLELTSDMTPSQRELLADFDNPTRAVIQEQEAQRLLRDIYSTHQLQEVMTSFWLNHFNVYLHKNQQEPYYLVSYERDVIRPRALGNFEDLLVATAESPAMLLYLDNAESTGPDSLAAQRQQRRSERGIIAKKSTSGLNENYARELMELQTLGVNGGYSQKDIPEVAKVFTGWTVNKPGQGGGFEFDETRHQPGKKLVIGRKIKENGQKEGLQLLHTLASSPATAHFISQELAIAFVSDTPPTALVNRMAKSFLASHGDIGTVLKTMLHAPEFWAPEAYRAKVKTPLEYVVSAARASNADISNTQPLVNVLNQMGMPLYACVPPTGYSAKAEEWVSTGSLVTRMNFALSFASNHYPGIRTSWTTEDSDDMTPELSERFLETQLIPSGISDQTRNAVLSETQNALSTKNTQPANHPAAMQPHNPGAQAAVERQNAQLAGLLLGSPEFQRR